MLLFKKKFLEAIREGRKTQTIRLWKHRRMRSGQSSYIPGVGCIQVASVEQVELVDLTEEDAQRDGFESAEALRAEIAAIYGEETAAIYGEETEEPAKQPYRVRFRVLEADETVE